MAYKFKTLYNSKNKNFVHFYESLIEGEYSFASGDMPMIMNHEVEVDDIISMLGEETILPTGTELKTIILKFQD